LTFPNLILKKGKEKSFLNRHPWVFSGAVASLPNASEGGIVCILSHEKKIIGYGHYIPGSTICCRIFSFGEKNDFNRAYWFEKFNAARLLREQWLPSETNGYRLLHAEGDHLPGLVTDIYGDAAVIQARTKGMQELLPILIEYLEENNIKHIAFKTDIHDEESDNIIWLKGNSPKAAFAENGIQFIADIEKGQKTGFFLDQRDNRFLLGSHCKGLSVLNTFSYTGGFSMYALKGGASRVVSVDLSKKALEIEKEIITLNNIDSSNHEAIATDCFDYLKQIPNDEFDVIVLDPPAFSKHISTVDKAARGYKEINLKALKKIKSGGLLYTFSCSQHISVTLFRQIIFSAAADSGRTVQVLHRLSQGPDHPTDLYHPEGEYLKGLLLKVS